MVSAGVQPQLRVKYRYHLFFELDFGTEIVTSERYNIFYDENMLSELDGAKMSPLAGRCKVPPAGLSVVWEG